MAVEIISIEARVASVARMKRINKTWQNKNKRHTYHKRKYVVHRAETGSFFFIFHASSQYQVRKVDKHTHSSGQLLGIIAPGCAPGIFSPYHACDHPQHTEQNVHIGIRYRLDIIFYIERPQVFDRIGKRIAEKNEHSEPHRYVVVEVSDGFVENKAHWHRREHAVNNR